MFYKFVLAKAIIWLSALNTIVISEATLQKEYLCSYIVEVQLHLQLTRIYLVKKYYLNNDIAESIRFSDEVQRVLENVYNRSDLEPAVNIMWIIYMYAIRVERYTDSVLGQIVLNKLEDDETLLTAHDSVSQLLKENMISEFCQLNYSRSKYIESYIKEVKYIEYLPRDFESNLDLITRNRSLFHNYIFMNPNTRHMFINQNSEHFLLGIVLNKVPGDESTVEILADTFSGLINWHPYWKHFYDFFYNENFETASLALEIYLHLKCQILFMEFLHTIIIHIIMKHLFYLKTIINQTGGRELDSKYDYHNKRLLSKIQEFTVFIDEDKEVYLPITYILDKQKQNIITKNDIDSCLNNIESVTDEVSSGIIQKINYSKLNVITDSYRLNSIINLNKFARIKSIIVDDQPLPILESILCVDIFVTYVKQLLNGIDFTKVNSFIQAALSDEYKKFKEIELAEKSRKISILEHENEKID